MTVRMRRSARLATWLAAIRPNASPRKAAKVTGGGPSCSMRARTCWNQARLASEESKAVTGRVFEASGDVLAVAEGWVRGPRVAPVDDPTKLGPIVADLVAKARKNSGMNGEPGGWPQPK